MYCYSDDDHKWKLIKEDRFFCEQHYVCTRCQETLLKRDGQEICTCDPCRMINPSTGTCCSCGRYVED